MHCPPTPRPAPHRADRTAGGDPAPARTCRDCPNPLPPHTCRDCPNPLPPHTGRGRPRVICEDCSAKARGRRNTRSRQRRYQQDPAYRQRRLAYNREWKRRQRAEARTRSSARGTDKVGPDRTGGD